MKHKIPQAKHTVKGRIMLQYYMHQQTVNSVSVPTIQEVKQIINDVIMHTKIFIKQNKRQSIIGLVSVQLY